MSNLNQKILFSMTAAPFWHCGRTVQGNSIHTLFALSLVIAMAFWHWGIPVLGVVTSVAIQTKFFGMLVMSPIFLHKFQMVAR